MPVLPPPIQWASAIGNFVIAFNDVEITTNLTLGYLYEPAVVKVLVGKWLTERLTFVEAGAKSGRLSDELRAAYRELMPKLKTMAEKRNIVAHGSVYWQVYMGEDGGSIEHKLNTQTGKMERGIDLVELKQMTVDVRALNKAYGIECGKLLAFMRPELGKYLKPTGKK